VSRRLLVLGWHNIEPTPSFGGTSAEAGHRGFARQLRFLRRWTTVVPLRDALADLAAGRPLPPRAVALTFDDGYLDNARVAAPALAAAGLPATFFLVPGFLSGTASAWWEDVGRTFTDGTAPELTWAGRRFDTSTPQGRREASDAVTAELKALDSAGRAAAVRELAALLEPRAVVRPRQFMDWQEARALLDAGFEVGSHTCSHPLLARESAAVQRRELAGARAELERELQRPVDVLAYPNGRAEDYSETTLRAVADAGYAFGVTTRAGLTSTDTPPHEVRRVLVDAETELRDVLLEGARALKRAVRARGRAA
jgi:peptidoglycan/xylan/chitin deacetylase (PgdA/CDA1 family)